MSAPLASVVVPTYNRADRHEALYETFASQSLAQQGLADMHVLDDSSEPSPFFSSLSDSRVHYRHVPERMSIGAKRNALAAGTGAEFCIQFDDDDKYAIQYCERKIAIMRETGADLAKLSVWNAICERDGSVWQWDTRTIGPEHYAVTGIAAPEKIPAEAMGETSQELLDSQLWGYGFSYTYRRDAWQRAPFQDMNLGEDYVFIRGLREIGAKLVHTPDMASSVLHALHPKSTSIILPQRRLESATLGSAMNLLPAGDVHVEPGVEYVMVALIKKTNALNDVTIKAQSWGLNVISVQDDVPPPSGHGAAPDDYRYILAEFTASESKKIPSKAPWPLSHLDKSRVVLTWSNRPLAPQVNAQLTPSAPAAAGVGRFLGRHATL
jgi:Glycosyl transferase family 2